MSALPTARPTERAPFPYFGGKAPASKLVWDRFGAVRNYVEPFFGSGAVLLNRPGEPDGVETVNDACGFVANFWRAVQADPESVAKWADNPVVECVPGGTKVATPGGPVNVEDVRPGMTVYGERDGRVVATEVVATKQSMAAEFVRVGPLRLTGNHPVWTAERGYVDADQLNVGMHVRILNNGVGENGLNMLRLRHEETPLDHLLAFGPTHKSRALCGCDVSWESSVQRAYVSRDQRRKNTSGLLDSLSGNERTQAGVQRTGGWRGRWMAGSRATLDCLAPRIADKSYRRRRRRARLCSDPGVASEMVGHAEGGSVFAGATPRDARQAAHAGVRGEDPSRQHGAEDARLNEGQDISPKKRAAALSGAEREVGRESSRKDVDGRTPREDCRIDEKQEAGLVRRDQPCLRVSDRDGENIGCQQGVRVSGDTQGLSLQRQSLSVCIAVYNFQTVTGNYFANGILVHNCDLHARHAWLVARADDLTARLEGDPDYHDPKIAGWWAWGACCWIGSEWCSGKGPWAVQDGKLVKGDSGRGVKRALPHLGDSGQGVNRKRPHLGDSGRGVKRPAVDRLEFIQDWMGRLSARLRASQFRVCCGDWTRVMGPVVLTAQKPCAVFLDPPYSADANRDMTLYRKESGDVARAVQEWAIAHGDDPRLRIALCGFAGEHAMPADWESVSWIYRGGYGNQNRGGNANANRERIWFSPHCLRPTESARMFY